MKINWSDWIGQVTTGHAAMVIGPTVLAVAGGQMDWATATPLLAAGAIGLLWPENTALKTTSQSLVTDVEALVSAYRAGLDHGGAAVTAAQPVASAPVSEPAAAPAPAPEPAASSAATKAAGAGVATLGLMMLGAGFVLSGCALGSSQQAAVISSTVTLASVAAAENTTAAKLLADGALVCGEASSVVGQLLEGTAVAVANAAGVPVSVTNQASTDVASACAALNLVAGPAPAGQSTLPVATVPTTTLPAVS